jgi:adenylosuccinate synthase
VNATLRHVLGVETQVSEASVVTYLEKAASLILPLIGNVSLALDYARKAEKSIVFEGAQGALLDQVHGTIPFVTSSNTIAGAVTTGCGIGPKHIDHVLGVAKAYCTRVGEGPFPTEIEGEYASVLRERGGEFGTTTGRPRRIGWFDAVAMKRAVRLSGVDSVAITKLDVLSGTEKIAICIKYLLDGKEVEDVPSLASELRRVKPVFIELEGWSEDLSRARKWHHLPVQARLYLSTLAEIIGCPVSIASVGAERESTLFSSSAAFLRNFVEAS